MDKIVEKLIELKDEEFMKFNSKLCPDTNYEILGIRIPILRKIAKELLRNEEYDIKKFIEKEDVVYFEEVILQGLIIGYSKLDFSLKMNYIKKFISKIDSWAICDTFVPTLKISKKDLEEYWNFILQFINSEKEFEIRFSIISMLDYFLIDKYVDEVIKILNNISHDGYYVKMGVAWIVAEIGVKYYDKAIIFLNNNDLDKFTHNKAIQKMIESYRIDENQKNYLRTLKRK